MRYGLSTVNLWISRTRDSVDEILAVVRIALRADAFAANLLDGALRA
jgi:hypothetical protein